jgi:hypothetical protein
MSANDAITKLNVGTGGHDIDESLVNNTLGTETTGKAHRARVALGADDGSLIPAIGQATMANSIPVAIASNHTAIPVSDNGGSLTVDSTGIPTGDTSVVGTINGAGQTVAIAMFGMTSSGMQLTAPGTTMTLVPEVSCDGGTSWTQTYFLSPDSNNAWLSSFQFLDRLDILRSCYVEGLHTFV